LSVLLALAAPPAAPVATAPKAPAAPAARLSIPLKSETRVDGERLQIVLGQRALFRLDDKGLPVLLKVENGQLAEAHPPGAAIRPFGPPPDGQIAAALDASAEKRVAVLKIWHRTSKPLDYRAIQFVKQRGDGVLAGVALPPGCSVPPRSVHTESWPRPVVAVGLGRFREAVATKACS